ncbi:hypothetical protein FN846DRAFT_229021 [Sphaerosporella brunnea]|uniref:NACHT domain-containing protein n=1 Tax=Sphaerosporella brunnea TaxID=1250544 RepID=A0A5J5ECE9_9PEZI|nr:hypothetical protein FN846DRAFT_550384 [Sphaerosporella brunnea]KAA8897773.1 hypothetical protein FN846DRAFT_229021 [Sphaerosporella brunnea]
MVIDALDEQFAKGEVSKFLLKLQQKFPKFRALLTSRSSEGIKEIAERLGSTCIEYDKERQGCLFSLYFENTRYDKITKEHKGSLEWLWAHKQYKEWSASDKSALLCIQGKPGCGKSTLAKYFNDNFMEREPKARSARTIISKFFYSNREGELQTSHYSMLRTILYNILYQDECFFFHFQAKYRQYMKEAHYGHVLEWPYRSLKEILRNIGRHPRAKRLYLIIDAVDEASETDRREVVQLLLDDLCSRTEIAPSGFVVKVFIASRPIGDLMHRMQESHHLITLQEETKQDIADLARSRLQSQELHFDGDILDQATTYIVEHAQGVFLWVHLVLEELLMCAQNGYTTKRIFDDLQSLPTELEDFYQFILKKLEKGKPDDITDGFRMFELVLFAYRPLKVMELRDALAVQELGQNKPSNQLFEQSRIKGMGKRLVHCCGNILENAKPDGDDGTIQFMHQTAREFFLQSAGYIGESKFKMGNLHDVHQKLSNVFIQYLRVCSAAIPSMIGPPTSWGSEQYEAIAESLNQKPLLNYIVPHLKQHINGCRPADTISSLFSQLMAELVDNPVSYLLEGNMDGIFSERPQLPAAHFGRYLLHAAARRNFTGAAEVALIAGADVEARLHGKTPLIVAAERGDDLTVRLLTMPIWHAEKEASDNFGRTALHWAASKGHDSTVRLLVGIGARKEARDQASKTPLHLAALESRHSTSGCS